MRVDGERHKPKSYCRLWYHLCYDHRTSQGMWFRSMLMGGPDCIWECSVGKVAGKRDMVQVLGKSCSLQLCKLKLHQLCKLYLPLAVKGGWTELGAWDPLEQKCPGNNESQTLRVCYFWNCEGVILHEVIYLMNLYFGEDIWNKGIIIRKGRNIYHDCDIVYM